MRYLLVGFLALLLSVSCKKENDTLPTALAEILYSNSCNPRYCMPYFQALDFEGGRTSYYYYGIVSGELCDLNPDRIYYYEADGTPIENGSALHNRLVQEGKPVGKKWMCRPDFIP